MTSNTETKDTHSHNRVPFGCTPECESNIKPDDELLNQDPVMWLPLLKKWRRAIIGQDEVQLIAKMDKISDYMKDRNLAKKVQFEIGNVLHGLRFRSGSLYERAYNEHGKLVLPESLDAYFDEEEVEEEDIKFTGRPLSQAWREVDATYNGGTEAFPPPPPGVMEALVKQLYSSK
jgi:hypothetical protein